MPTIPRQKVVHAVNGCHRVAETFKSAPLTVVGLHTVFEHHEAMGLELLRAFLHEYRVQFPVGVDAPGRGGDPMPRTMRAYGIQGTPTTLLIDAEGRLRRQVFGVYDELLLGAEISTLLAEAGRSAAIPAMTVVPETDGCADGRCGIE